MPRIKSDREAIKREATRIALAFDFARFKGDRSGYYLSCEATHSRKRLRGSWKVDYKEVKFQGLYVTDTNTMGRAARSEIYENGVWKVGVFDDKHRHFFALGLYCLGFDDEYVMSKINCPLSIEERVSCRERMPRDLWPQCWVNAPEHLKELEYMKWLTVVVPKIRMASIHGDSSVIEKFEAVMPADRQDEYKRNYWATVYKFFEEESNIVEEARTKSSVKALEVNFKSTALVETFRTAKTFDEALLVTV